MHGVLAVLDAVIDTGPLIHLHEIDRLNLVTAVFRNIHLPKHVEREIRNEPIIQYIHQNTDRITIHLIQEPELFSTKDAFSGYHLQLADLAVLALLTKIIDACAVTDDLELRKAVESNGRTAVGTIGMLFSGFRLSVIDKPQLRQLVNQVFNDSSLYMSSAFRSRVLAIVDGL